MSTLACNTLFSASARVVTLVVSLLITACGGADSTSAPNAQVEPQADDSPAIVSVNFDTSHGSFVIDLNEQAAPLTVENFLNYVDSGFYDGTIFHRVIEGFMIQGGGYTDDFVQKQTLDPVANEADNGLLNTRYSIAMARLPDPQSATAQFFINVEDNDFLDYRAPTTSGWGYAVFGEVSSGVEVIDQIEALATGAGGHFVKDVPQDTVLINSITRVTQ